MIPKIQRPEDPTKINLKNPFEVNWWCVELGVTYQGLIEAINAVGVSVDSVKLRLDNNYLSQNKG